MKPAELALLGTALLVLGCGAEEPAPRTLTGDRVGRMAEEQLEVQHPSMARGTMSCQDLDLEIDATTRCIRTAELSGGRIVRVNGTVRVTSLDDGGRLRVKLDDEIVSFGVSGEHLASRVGPRLGLDGDDVSCPDLDGTVGTTVVCESAKGDVEVLVVAVDPATFDVDYRIGDPGRPR